MPDSIFDEMKRFVGFSQRDADELRAIAPYVERFLPHVVDRFYTQILRHPSARAVFTGGEAQLERLRCSLADWVRSLFSGLYDEKYARDRERIGQAHVRVGLPQHYMFTAMEVVHEEIIAGLRRLEVSGLEAKLPALSRLFTLELGLMLESYKASYSDELRRLEREAMQERLSQAEHLAQIGQLAASLAHEIKNPLAGISGAIQVIRESLSSGNPHRPILTEVLRQINRLDGTVKDLLVYARPKPPRLRSCDLARVFERLRAVLSTEPEFQRVRIEYRGASLVPAFPADEHQLEQLLLNLILNAAQASPDRETVRVTAGVVGDHVRLVVADRGPGMDPELARKALEPFFTTKAKGTGLGLPICQKIAEAHGGRIVIDSRAGEGTEVRVELPRTTPPNARGTDD